MTLFEGIKLRPANFKIKLLFTVLVVYEDDVYESEDPVDLLEIVLTNQVKLTFLAARFLLPVNRLSPIIMNPSLFGLSEMDVLSESIWDYYQRTAQTEATLLRKLHLRDMIYCAISPLFPREFLILQKQKSKNSYVLHMSRMFFFSKFSKRVIIDENKIVDCIVSKTAVLSEVHSTFISYSDNSKVLIIINDFSEWLVCSRFFTERLR